MGRGGQMPAGEGHIDANDTGRSVGTAGVARAVRLVGRHQPALAGAVGLPPGVEQAVVERGVDEAFSEQFGADSLPDPVDVAGPFRHRGGRVARGKLNDLESAILATLTPGAYSAVVRGRNNTTGIGYVQFYSLPHSGPVLKLTP